MLGDRGVVVVEDILSAVWKKRDSRRRSRPSEAHWRLDEEGRPGCSFVVEALVACLRRMDPEAASRSKLGQDLFGKIDHDLPRRRHGPRGERKECLDDSVEWDVKTCIGWFSHKGVMPPNIDVRRRVLEASARMIGNKLNRDRSPLVDIVPLIHACYASERDFVTALASGLRGTESDELVLPSAFVSWRGPSFELRPDAAHPGPLKALADQVLSFLREDAGRRYVRLGGAPHSGKKTVLRYVLGDLADEKLHLANGVVLPVLAVALDDHTPDEFVGVVHSFYIKSRPVETHESHGSADLSVRGKLEQIQVLANRAPACIILADVGAIDDNELVRGWSGDHVGDLIFALLRSHRHFRLVLTSPAEERSSFDKEAERLCEQHLFLPVPEVLERDQIEGIPRDFQPEFSRDIRASGLSWRLAQCMLSLAAGRTPSHGEASRVRRQCATCLELGVPQRFVALIFQMLTAEERLVVGLVSSSRDGLRESVLLRMAAAMCAAQILPNSGYPLDEKRVASLRSSLRSIIQGRPIKADLGQAPYEPIPEEILLTLDAGWRRHFLEAWWQADPKVARFAQWLIAREAANQSRLIRARSRGQGGSVNLGRDVQGLQALLASIDPGEIVAHHSLHHDGPLEASILPIVEEPAQLLILAAR